MLIEGDALRNNLLGSAEGDTMNGLDNNDTLRGAGGTDTLNGGNGDDLLFSVNDPIDHDKFDIPTTDYALFGDGLAEVLNGEAGDDELVGDFYATYDGGTGADHAFISLTEATSAITFVHGGGTAVPYSFVMAGVNRGSIFAVEAVDLYGSAFNDFLSVGTGADRVQAFAGNDTVNGNGGNDILRGGDGNDSLSGGTERDELRGGAGIDTLDGGDGNDTLFASSEPGTYDKFNGIDTDLTAFGDGAMDVLNGGLGSDDLVGDIFTIFDGGAGTADSAFVSAFNASAALNFAYGGSDGTAYSFVIGGVARGNVKNVEAFVVYGSAFADTVVTAIGSDAIDGGSGNDTLSGSGGRDTVGGGDGADIVNGGDANDVLFATSNVANYTVFDHPDTKYGDFGDGAADTLNGGVGNDSLVGDHFTFFRGDAGTDRAFVSFTEASAAISFTPGGTAGAAYSFIMGGVARGNAVDVENYDLYGSNFGDTFNMFTGDDRIEANGGNDTINGGDGADTLRGGEGNDIIDGGFDDDELSGNGGIDTINGGQGNDIIFALIEPGSYERFDSPAIKQLDFGNLLSEVLNGGDGDDLILADHFSIVDGGTGGDRAYIGMAQGASAVTFVYGGAANTAYSFVMGGVARGNIRNVENFDLYGSDFNDRFTTHDGVDRLSGRDGNDTLSGMGGNDSLNGGNGDDSQLGGEGADTLSGGNDTDRMEGGNGDDVLFAVADPKDYALFEDTSTDYDKFGDGSADSLFGGDGNDNLVGDAFSTYNGGTGIDRAYVSLFEAVAGATFVYGGVAGISYDFVVDGLTHGNVTDVEAFDIYGSDYGDLISLAGGDDRVQGHDGNDTIIGGAGADILHGGDGDDRLIGGAGSDTLVGGAGNDTYVNLDPADIVQEAAGDAGGLGDAIESETTIALAGYVNIENIILAGSSNINATGNDIANALTGNTGANRLTGGLGNDTLSGAAGIDTLFGGTGNDIYVNPTGDIVVENANEGLDTVWSSATFSIGPIANVENLTLTGTADIDGAGNAYDNLILGNSGANRLTGFNGLDTLDGGAGNDTLDGGALLDRLKGGEGDDTYLNPTGDIIGENADSGFDTVESAISFSLASIANVENLTLTGSTAIDGNGNDLGNVLTGNSGANVFNAAAGDDTLIGLGGNDRLNGNNGADTLIGGAGQDRLAPAADAFIDVIRTDAVADATGITRDTIIGMDLNGEDVFDLPAVPTSIAANIATGVLNEASFDANLTAAVTAAKMGAGQAVLFNPNSGTADYSNTVYLIVDANGIAGYQSGQDYVFQLEGHAGTVDASDFV